MSEAFRGRRGLLATPMVTTFAEVFGGLRSPASVLAMQALELPRLQGVRVRPIARLERVEAQQPEHPAGGAGSWPSPFSPERATENSGRACATRTSVLRKTGFCGC